MALVVAEPAERSAGFALLDAALAYVELGWPVLPIAPRGKIPLTTHGLKDATTDAKLVREWWERWPTANVGIATGPPGPTVIDCDGAVGRHEWLKLVSGIGWEGAPWCCTGGGGWHIYFAGDADIRNRAGWLPKVDLRGVGGYVVAPPSVHEWGSVYEWDRAPEYGAAPEMPALVRNVLGKAPYPCPPSTSPRTLRMASSAGRGYGRAALDGELDKVRAAPVGARNHTLVAAAFSLGQLVSTGQLERDEVIPALFNAGCAAGLDEVETLRTIASGLRAGIERPRQ